MKTNYNLGDLVIFVLDTNCSLVRGKRTPKAGHRIVTSDKQRSDSDRPRKPKLRQVQDMESIWWAILSVDIQFRWSNNDDESRFEIEIAETTFKLLNWKLSRKYSLLANTWSLGNKSLNVILTKRYSNWFNLRIWIQQLLSRHLHEINVNQLCWINKHDLKGWFSIKSF